MSKKNKNNVLAKLSTGLVPKLRFPEFENDGEWSYSNGDELFEPIVNKNHKSDLPILAITQEQGAIPRNMIDYHVSVTEKSVESYKVVEVGDFIISLRSFQGGIEYSFYKGLCSPAYIILRKKFDIENDFYRHYFKSFPFIRDLNKNLEGIRDGKMISYKQFSEILIPNPTPTEQQKIASCLSSLDGVITAESQKLGVLKDHKKGLLQNLFPTDSITNDQLRITDNTRNSITNDQLRITDNTRNSITNDQLRITDNTKTRNSKFVIRNSAVPKFRFKEFENSGEWVVKKLGEMAEINPSAKKLPQNFIYIDLESVEDGVLLQRKLISLDDAPSRAQRLLKNEDVIFQMVRPYQKNNYYFKPKDNFDYVASTGYAQLRAKESAMYLFQYLHHENFVAMVLAKCTGSNYPAIKASDLFEILIVIPPSIQEQQKIASCLSSIDDLIIAQNQKIEALQSHKKGLLQGLFPSITNYESENYDNNVIRNSKFLIEK